ncbi:MAG: fasciclin domain-containing protein [Thermoanaerobaculia bacterium]
MKKTLAAAVFAALVASAGAASAQTVMVGGMAMYPTKDIVDNAVNSADHTTLVAAVKAAGLVSTLKGKGPFTVFAPVNDAFKDLPDGTVATLLKPENKAALTRVLTYHVVSGRLEADDLRAMIKKGNGRATLHTVSGGMLYASMNGPRNIVITDEAGTTAHISTYDVNQSNGVIQVIDRVLMPKM